MNTAILMDVKRFSVHDGPGVRTTLFFKGCTLKCKWCHNPEGLYPQPEMSYYSRKCLNCGECAIVCPQKAHIFSDKGHEFQKNLCVSCGKCEEVCLGEAMRKYGKSITVDAAMNIALEDRCFYHETGGITVSGGEPLRNSSFIAELFSKLKSEKIHTAIDTCGNVSWKDFQRVLPFTDLFLYDIKHWDSNCHLQWTGCGNELILSNLARLSQAGAQIEVRIPLIPGCNDDITVLENIANFLLRHRIFNVRILPYHDLSRSKYEALQMNYSMPDIPSPYSECISKIVQYYQNLGLNALSG